MPSDDPTLDDAFSKLVKQYEEAVEGKDFGDAEVIVHDLFALAQDWCERNPSPELELTNAAGQCEENADWSGAESAYRQILSLPGVAPAMVCKAHSDLAGLHKLLSRHSDALTEACHATAAARRAEIPILLAITLVGEARCLILCGQLEGARSVIAEALSIGVGDKAFNQIRASILILRAECAVRSGQHCAAASDLEEAFALLRPLSDLEFAAGVQRDVADWWSVTGMLRAAREDFDGAVDAWRRAVSVSEHLASLPQVEEVYWHAFVANMLGSLGRALTVAGRNTEATSTFTERKTILTRLGLPDGDVA